MRSPRFAPFAAAAVVAAGIVLASSRGDVDRMTIGDGLIYRYVAAHFSTPPEAIDPVVSSRGTSLRYGRVGLPALIWLGSAGRPQAMPYVQPILMVLAAGGAGGATAKLLPRAGPIAALFPFLAPGFTLAVSGGFAEAPAVAFGLWAVVWAGERRWVPAAVMLVAAMLTRENAGALLVGMAVWLLLRKTIRPIAILGLSVVPLIAWYGFVASRYGEIPILDPYLRVTTETIAAPGVAIWRALTDSTASGTLTAALHLALALVAFALWRRSMTGAIAAAAGLQVLAAGRFSFVYEGEAFRQFAFLQLFLLMALVWSRWGGAEQEARAEDG
ncbi:MAG: hypothetical protein ACRDKG_00590 [Actinomycetota bacterium]